jgi:hypothetical protein
MRIGKLNSQGYIRNGLHALNIVQLCKAMAKMNIQTESGLSYLQFLVQGWYVDC